MNLLKIQALVDSNVDVTVQQLEDAGYDLGVGSCFSSKDTLVGRVVQAGRSSYSIVFLPVEQEQADLMKARLEWFQNKYPGSDTKNYFRPDGTLPINGWWIMGDWMAWNGVPETHAGLV